VKFASREDWGAPSADGEAERPRTPVEAEG
jgi:hypothetical protein